MRILYCVSTLGRSGPTNQLFHLIRYLPREEFEARVLTLSPEPVNSDWERYAKLGIRIESLNRGRVTSFLVGRHLLRKKIREVSPDLIHTQGIRADILLSRIRPNQPWILTQRNYPWEDYPMKYGGLKGKLMSGKHVAAIRSCKYPVACGKNLADRMRKAHSIAQMRFVENGVDTASFTRLKEGEKHQLRRKLHIPEHAQVFIAVGSLIARKNNGVVLEAFKKADLPGSLLLFAGDGVEKEKLQRLSGEDDRVRFLGFVKNVEDYLRCADCFLSASLSEGLPNVVFEAMAVGLPVLLSDIPPHKELCGESYPFFFSPGDAEELSGQYKKIVMEGCAELKKGTPGLIKQTFSAESMSQKYQNIYKEVTREN